MKQKIGISLVWIGILCLLINYILQWISSPVFKVNTPEELAGSIWATDGFLFTLNGIVTAMGVGFSIIGILLYSSGKSSLFWLWGFVPFISFGLLTNWHPSQSFPPLFGIGGGIITLSYFGVLLVWIRTHTSYEGGAKKGKHIQLIGYSFLYIAALYLCIHLGTPKHPALADLSVVGSESIIAAFSIGFFLLFIGHYLSGQQKKLA